MKKLKNIVVFGANGGIATLLLSVVKKYLKTPITTIGIDLYAPISKGFYDRFIIADVTKKVDFLKFRTVLKTADIILLCLPEKETLSILTGVLQDVHTEALLVESLSVKTNFYTELQSYLKNNDKGPEIVGIHPLFGPSLGCSNQSIATINYRPGQQGELFLKLFADAGAKLCPLNVQAHDNDMAAIQVATHAAALIYGMVLDQLGYKASENHSLWTPTHRHLLQLLARIIDCGPEVYQEIQLGNPNGKSIRDSYCHMAEKFDTIVTNKEEFNSLFKKLRLVLGSENKKLVRECELILHNLANLD